MKAIKLLAYTLLCVFALGFLVACGGSGSDSGSDSNATLVSIKVLPGSAMIAATGTLQFTAIGTYSDGSTSDLTSSVTWSSSDNAIATVSNSAGSMGLATGITAGIVTVSALDAGTGISSADTAQSATFTVTNATLVSIKVESGSAMIAVAGTLQFTSIGTYSDGSALDLTSSVTWSSSDIAIATVSNTVGIEGLATGITAGTVTVSALHPGTGISSGDTAQSASVVVTVPTGGNVLPLYSSNGASWNDYVKHDGSDIFSATDTACNPATDTSCLHGGQMRYIEVTGRSVCTGLTASDILGVFKWQCDESTNPVRMVSTGLKNGASLSDLIDFTTAAWKKNVLTINLNGDPYILSLVTRWWNNAIVVNNNGSTGLDMVAGEIHIVTTNPAATYTMGADKVALVIKPGVTLTGTATTLEKIISATNRNFLWLEGKVDATGDISGYYLNATVFSVLDNVQVNNAFYGVYLQNFSKNNTLSNITATGNGNGNGGVYLNTSSNNTLRNITATGNGNGNGVALYYADNNTLSNITATGNSYDGVNFYNSSNNTLSNITATNNTQCGVHLSSSSNNNTLSNISATGSVYGVRLNGSENNTLSNITATGNSYGVNVDVSHFNTLNNISASSNSQYGVNLNFSHINNFTGLLKVAGNATAQCYESGGINPGLVDGTCTTDGAEGSTGYGIGNSSDASYSTDTTILNVLALPTGNDTLTHLWIAADATACGIIADATWGTGVCSIPGYDNQTDCETGLGDWTTDKCYTIMLRNAVEIQEDTLGNENNLCETDETCLYTPNIGAAQGSGSLTPLTFNDAGGTALINGVTLMEYENNP